MNSCNLPWRQNNRCPLTCQTGTAISVQRSGKDLNFLSQPVSPMLLQPSDDRAAGPGSGKQRCPTFRRFKFADHLENRSSASPDEQGQFAVLRQPQRDVLQAGCKGNVLRAFETNRCSSRTGISSLLQQKAGWFDQVHNRSDRKWSCPGGLALRGPFWTRSSSDIYLYNQLPRIDFDTFSMVRRRAAAYVEFPWSTSTPHMATFDIQFGNVTVPTHWTPRGTGHASRFCAQDCRPFEEGLWRRCSMTASMATTYGTGVMRLTLPQKRLHPIPMQTVSSTLMYALYPLWAAGVRPDHAAGL